MDPQTNIRSSEVEELGGSPTSSSVHCNEPSSCPAPVTISGEQNVEVVEEREVKMLQRQVARLQTNLEHLQRLHESERESNKILLKNTEDWKFQKIECESEIEKLRKTLGTKNLKCEKLVEENDKLVAELASSKSQNEQLTLKNEELNGKLEEIKQFKATMRMNNVKLNQTNSILTNVLATKTNELKEFEDMFRTASKPIWELYQLREKKGEAESKKADLHISVNDKNAKLVSEIANTKLSLENLKQCQQALLTSSQQICGINQEPRENNRAAKNGSEIIEQETEPGPSRRSERVPSSNKESAKQKKVNNRVPKLGKNHRFICTVCRVPYTRQEYLTKHMKLKHQQEEYENTEDENTEDIEVDAEGPPPKKNCQAEDLRNAVVLLEKLPEKLDKVEQKEDELLDV